MSMWNWILGFLCIVTVSMWFVVATYPDDNFHVIACDVGQGDAYLVIYRKTQIVIDGGPGKKVIGCLERHIPFWDRDIELIISTHPQLDHYEGLIEIVKRYNVQVFTANSLKSDALEYRVLNDLVGTEHSKVVIPLKGSTFKSNLLTIEIIHPTAEFYAENTKKDPSSNFYLGNDTTDLDPNEFSVVAKVTFGEFDALFTGDGETIWDTLSQSGSLTDIEYLKVPHHGSKNGLTKSLLDSVTPEIAVISNGKRNSYGHPHKETLEMLQESHVFVYRTDELGDVEVVSDGRRYWMK